MGAIEVDPGTLETSVKEIYAIGDVTGGIMLAHVASQRRRCSCCECSF